MGMDCRNLAEMVGQLKRDNIPMNQHIDASVWPGQVHFGSGSVGLVAEELKALKARHVFIVADPGVIAAGLIETVTNPRSVSQTDLEQLYLLFARPGLGS